MRRLLKFLHELGTVGLMGAAATQLVLSYAAEGMPDRDYAVTRLAILRVSELLLIPSLLVVLVSGLVAMIANPTYSKRGWALLKAALTVIVLQCALVSVQGPAQQAAHISVAIVKGDRSDAHHLPGIVRHERGGTAILLILSVANVALAVWRPRFRKKPRRSAQNEAAERDDTANAEEESTDEQGTEHQEVEEKDAAPSAAE